LFDFSHIKTVKYHHNGLAMFIAMRLLLMLPAA